MTKSANAMGTKNNIEFGGVYRLVFKHVDNWEGGRERLYIDGRLVGSCGGGGYDMRGACLGEFLTNAFKGELEALWERVEDQPERPYGLYEGGYVNGACGLNCMIEIAGLIGLEIWWDCASGRYWIRKRGEKHV